MIVNRIWLTIENGSEDLWFVANERKFCGILKVLFTYHTVVSLRMRCGIYDWRDLMLID